MKEYITMTEQERTEWAVRFAEFLKSDYANIKSQGEGWKKSFERGLKLFEPLMIADDFVRSAKEFMDYERRIDQMSFLVDEMRRQVIEVDGDVLSRIAAPTKRKVGRPTKEEVREYAKQEQEEQTGKVDALAQIAGMTLPEKEKKPAKEEEKPGAVVGDLFAEPSKPATPATPPASDNDSNVNAPVAEAGKLRLQEIKHLLPGELQDAVDTVAMLRSRAATESELAKELVMNGGKQEEISKHAKAACECTNAYEDIYARVDMALAQLYVNTKKNDKYIKHGETRESQLAKTEPYYQKVSKVSKVEETKEEPHDANKPNKANEPKKDQPVMSKADKAALLHKHRTYIMRKDAKITQKRVERIEQIIAELKEMGVPTDEYEVVLEESKKQLAKK
jgi:hypothetical protein